MVDAIATLLSLQVWLMLLVGMAAGIIIGALPGLSPPMGIALALPFTMVVPPEQGLVLLGSIYTGAIWGGSITATLIRTPGTPAQVVTVLDAYPMAQKGYPKRALLISLIASFHGGIGGVLALILMAPLLAKVALSFGPAEMFWIGIFGVLAIAIVAGDGTETGYARVQSFTKALVAGLFGMLLSTVGLDPAGLTYRFTGNIGEFTGGIDLIAAMVGLFAFSQVIEMLVSAQGNPDEINVRQPAPLLTVWREVLQYPRTGIVSTLCGIGLGILPAAGATISSIVAYMIAKRYSRRPQEFGKGSAEGIIASETANNACVGGSLVPTLALGVPGNAASAVLIGGLLIHGLIPGPQLFTQHANVTAAFFAGLLAAQFVMLVVGRLLVPIYSWVLLIPPRNLAPLVAVLCFVGTFAVNENIVDVYVMAIMGLIGYWGAIRGFSPAAMVLGLILGRLIERSLLLSIQIASASGTIWGYMFLRPISIVIIALMVLVAIVPMIFRSWMAARQPSANVDALET